MALNKDILGQLLFDARNQFCDKSPEELLQMYGSWPAIRLAACKADAEAIIQHLQTDAALSVPGTGLQAGQVPVTGTSITGKIL